jgi:hypothetical protein
MRGLRIVIVASMVVLLTIAAVAVPRILAGRILPISPGATAGNPAQFYAAPGRRPVQPPSQTLEDGPHRMDLRGNEIARPVARYRVDGRGTLYEVHSPQTEVPRLKAPTL